MIRRKMTVEPKRTRIDLESITKSVTEESASRRFSSLDQTALVQLWREISTFIVSQLILNRSVFLPGIGHFYVRRKGTKDAEKPLFVPAHTWDQFPGFRIPRNAIQNATPADNLNYWAISLEGKFKRDDVETGFKDISHVLLFQLRTKSSESYSIAFPKLGELQVQNKRVHFRFDEELLDQLEDLEKPRKEAAKKETTSRPSSASADAKKVENNADTTASDSSDTKSSCTSSESSKPHDTSITSSDSAPLDRNITVRGQGLLEPLPGGSAYPPLRSKPDTLDHLKTLPGFPELAGMDVERDPDMDYIYGLISFKDFHTHPFSGDRLWSNHKCPICRQNGIPPLENLKNELKRKDSEQDRLLLSLSMEVDKEFLRKKKELETERQKELFSIAQYNLKQAEEKKNKLKSGTTEMGDLFETRLPPPDKRALNQQNGALLMEQIQKRKQQQEQEVAQKELEDRILNQRFVQKFRKEEAENIYHKLQRQQKLRQDLNKQVYEKTHQPSIPNPEVEKCFANDESALIQHQKERAKKLYQEQMALLQQKREYEARVAEIQLQSQLERLALSKTRLNNDVEKVKKMKFQTRKSLEEYWAQQVNFRQSHLNPYDE